MTRLSVNVNKVALLRNSRGTDYPNVERMARRAIEAGAHGITVHPRPDQRHIRYSDVYELSGLVGSYSEAEFNVEGNPIPDFLRIVTEVRPNQCTLVPDDPDQLTSDHGWKLDADGERLRPIVEELHEAGIRVSLFMDPDKRQLDRVPATGADRIELYTESYAHAFGTETEDAVWECFARAATHANNLGLGVNAGHDLNLRNLPRFLTIPSILEVSIGHAIVADSFDYGFENTLERYLRIVSHAIESAPRA